MVEVLQALYLSTVTEIGADLKEWIELASLLVEVVAVIIIVVAVLFGTARYAFWVLTDRSEMARRYTQYKHSLGKALLLGLEILVAADVVRTVALEATLESVVVLGLLVVIRTFLSWSLVVEIEGRWPWQPARELDSVEANVSG